MGNTQCTLHESPDGRLIEAHPGSKTEYFVLPLFEPRQILGIYALIARMHTFKALMHFAKANMGIAISA